MMTSFMPFVSKDLFYFKQKVFLFKKTGWLCVSSSLDYVGSNDCRCRMTVMTNFMPSDGSDLFYSKLKVLLVKKGDGYV